MIGRSMLEWRPARGSPLWNGAVRSYSLELMPEEQLDTAETGSTDPDQPEDQPNPEMSVGEIPGPPICPIIGTSYNYWFGAYSLDHMGASGLKKYEQFGPIVREKMGYMDTISIFKPEDIRTIFLNENNPTRYSHTAVEKYRLERSQYYNTPGLLASNGEVWSKLRKVLQEPLGKRENYRRYVPISDKIIDKFQAVISARIDRPPEDFVPHFFDVYQELVGVIAFDTELQCLDPASKWDDSVGGNLKEAARVITEVVPKLDVSTQIWKHIMTPLYWKFKKAHLVLERVAITCVDNKNELLKKRGRTKNPSLLEIYLDDNRLDIKDVYGTAVDLMIAGVDVLSYSTSFQLYYLATNPKVQQKLFEEARTLLPKRDTPITAEVLNQCSYTKACIKESFRMTPNAFGTGRVVSKKGGHLLSGYRVLEGMNILTQMQVSCRLPRYFENPHSFIPERWERPKERDEEDLLRQWLLLPFSSGVRACIARRFAEQTMQMMLLRTIRCYHVIWEGGKLGCIGSPNRPDRPLFLKFKPRS